METYQLSLNTILISAAVIFIGGAFFGGRIVTYFYFIFGRRGERSRRGRRSRRRDDRYDDDRYDSDRYDDYDDRPRPPLGLYLVVLALLAVFAFLGYQRFMGRNVGQELQPANHSEYESYGSSQQLPSGSKNGTTAAPETAESLNREVYDPAYAPAAPEDSPTVAEAPARALPIKYLIQKGTFSDWEDAKAEMKDMSEQGMNAGYWTLTSADGSPAYAVFTGMFRSRSDAKVFRQVRCNGKGSIRSSEGLDLRAFKE